MNKTETTQERRTVNEDYFGKRYSQGSAAPKFDGYSIFHVDRDIMSSCGNRQIRCAIIRPRPEGREWEKEEPLGSEAVCGYLRAHGIECHVFDRRLRKYHENGSAAFAAQIEAYSPDAIGFSLMTQEDLSDALRLLQRVKRPGRVFFAGGLLVTTEPDRCRALFPEGTHIIPGEGEGPVLALMIRAARGWAVPEVQKTVLPGMIPGSDLLPLPGPDDWAFPARDDLNHYLSAGGTIHLRSARGCRGGCRFCTTPMVSHGRHEERDLSLVTKEMALLTAKGYPPVFNFTDDEFGDLDRIESLIDHLHSANLKAAFSLELRPSVMCRGSEKLWSHLHRGGLCRVFTGLENLDPDVLRRWGKAGDPYRLLEAVSQCRKAGILCETGYIMFHKGSTADIIRKQIKVLHQYDLFTPKAALSRLILYPGSALHRESGNQGTAAEPLTPEIRRLYDMVQGELDDLYERWTQAAVRLPNSACHAFLTGDDRNQRELENELKRINAESFRIMEHIMEELA